jgi:DNA helicase II / ATP-dependent DNA helicase PcrA
MCVSGTFHAICGRLLRQHGSAIKLPHNFSICDSDESSVFHAPVQGAPSYQTHSKKIINGILKDMVTTLGLHGSGKRIDVRDSVAVDLISKAKSRGLSPEELEAKAHHDIASKDPLPKGETDPHFMLQLCDVYAQYVKVCRKNNALDFDDLLMFGVKLLKEKPSCIDYEHVFVDEFQDTNITQLQLMTHFAARNGNVSVVGDPDQSSESSARWFSTL